MKKRAKTVTRGRNMVSGSGWTLTSKNGRRFKGTLLGTMNRNLKGTRLAIFSVPKRA